MPMASASAKSYFSSRPVAPISASVMPGVIVRYQDVPLVEGDVDGAGLGVADARGLDLALHHLDAVVEVARDGQELLEVALAVADVGVERDVVDLALQPVEHGAVPAHPVRARPEVRGAGGDELDRRVGAAHGLGRLQGELGVVLGVLVAELPGPVDLVAQAPDLDVPGLVAAVLAPLLRPVGVAGFVRVFDPVAGVLHRAQPGVDAQVGLDPELLGITSGTRPCRSGCSRSRPRPGRGGPAAGRAGRCRPSSCSRRRSCRPASAGGSRRAPSRPP